MRIGWKAYLRSGQIIGFTAEHDAPRQKINWEAWAIDGSSPWIAFCEESLASLAHDTFRLAGSVTITKAAHDAAYEEALSQLDKASDRPVEHTKAIARCMVEDYFCVKHGVRFKNIHPNQEGDGYILSWPDHVTARC